MRILTLAMAFSCSVVFGTLVSQADTVPAMQGHGWPNRFDSCFGSSWALMRNNCSGTVGSQRLLIIPTQSDWQTYDFVWAAASGNGSNGMTNCQGIVTNMTTSGQTAIAFTQRVSTSTSSSLQWLNLGKLNAFPYTPLHFECFVAQGGGTVYSVSFNPSISIF